MILFPDLAGAAIQRGPDSSGAFSLLEGPDLAASVGAVAERLLISRVRRVAVYAVNEWKSIVGLLGALRAGVAVVVVAPQWSLAQRDLVLAHSTPDAWLGVPPPSDAPATLPLIPVSLHARSWHSLPEPPAGAAALWWYDVDSEGDLDLVVYSHQAVADCLDELAREWAWTRKDSLVHSVALSSVVGLVVGVLGPIRRGGRVVVTDSSPESLAQAIAPYQGSHLLVMASADVWPHIAEDAALAHSVGSARILLNAASDFWESSHSFPGLAAQNVVANLGGSPLSVYASKETVIVLPSQHDAGEVRVLPEGSE